MSNPFSEKNRMSIPRDLDDCCVTDSTSRELWKIAETVEAWGMFILIGILVLGIIVSIGAAVSVNEHSSGSAFTTFMYSAVVWVILALVEYVGYHLIALSLRAIASVVQNTRVSANVALYNASINENKSSNSQSNNTSPPTPTPIPSKKNSKETEEVTPPKPPVSPVIHTDEEIVCPSCGKKQRAGRKVCWSCNQPFATE